MRKFYLLILACVCISIFLVSSCTNKPVDLGAALKAAEKSKTLYALEVYQGGETLYSGRYNGADDDALLNIQGIHKSLVSLIYGNALHNKILRELDYRIFPYLLQYSSSFYAEKEEITFRHLLDQTSGIHWDESEELKIWEESHSATEYSIGKILVETPGTVYNYSTGLTHLMSFITEVAANISIRLYAHLNVYEPIGIGDYRWEILSGGFYDAGGVKVWMQAKDLVKFGQLMLNQGNWDNKVIFSKSFYDELANPDIKRNVPVGIPESKHGLCWYSAVYQGTNILYGRGYGGQYLIVIPDLDAIIVSLQEYNTPHGLEQESYFTTRIFPGLFNSLKSNLQ